MILTSFVAKNLHGYLNFNVHFNRRLSFLTGINGSGKTTVLNCVQALLSPDLSILQSLTYTKIRLSFLLDDGSKAYIEASQSNSVIAISSSHSDQQYEYIRYVPDPGLPTSRQTEGELEHFRDLMATSMGHPVMAFISDLPTPMFLGLDRRAKLAAEERRPGMLYRTRYIPHRRPLRGMLGTSLNEAEDIVVDAYRDARISSGRVSEELQRQLILNLIAPSQDSLSDISLPTEAEKRTLIRVQSDLESFPGIFRLPPGEVNKRVKPFIHHLEDVLRNIPADANPEKDFDKHGKPPSYFDSLISWSTSKSQLKKIAVISQMVSSYNERQSAALQPFENYKALVRGCLENRWRGLS